MMMIPAYNKKVCAVFPFQMGIHYRPTPFPKKMQPCLTRNSNPFDKPISRNYEGSERRYFRGRFRSIPTSLWPPLAKKSAPCASYEPWVNFRENFAKQKRNIGRLECGRTQLELGIDQSVISRLWQRFQDDGNVSRCYSTGRPRGYNAE
ncbi:uncharacterized protein TNCV_3019262 [Trichonephila clavipes]|nr:uncharacterized protein TNCV_3019262 [Trichonephila clavipes]